MHFLVTTGTKKAAFTSTMVVATASHVRMRSTYEIAKLISSIAAHESIPSVSGMSSFRTYATMPQ